jgi:tetratricopeptide (TPR) repeat protein
MNLGSSPTRALRTRFLALALGAAVPAAAVVVAGRPHDALAQQDGSSPQRDAARHFERAVALYAEADYQAALVEFKRAYATVPNPTVLYNIGETEYQLQSYADALAAFTRYLSDAPPGAPHRGEVEASIEVLKARVGHLSIVTVPPGAEVSVDDVLLGKTPLAERLVVSVGHRKVTATLAGRAPAVRYVDVAADESASLFVELPPSGVADAVMPLGGRAEPVAPAHGSSALRTLGWIGTGMLAAGATAAGALALKASSDLQNDRNTYPVAPATLQADADHTRTYSVLADSLTAAAVVVGSVTLIATLLAPSAARSGSTAATARVKLSPAAAHLEVTF